MVQIILDEDRGAYEAFIAKLTDALAPKLVAMMKKTPQTVCYEIQREIVGEARRYPAKSYKILASQAVIDLLLDEESQSLAMLIDFIGAPITLAVETSYNQEQFDIILM